MTSDAPGTSHSADESTAALLRRRQYERVPFGPLELLLENEGAWLIRRVRHTATAYRVDAEELYQETVLALLRSSTAVDVHQRGLRTWLSRRIEWMAVDLLRRERRARAAVWDVEDIEDEINLVVAVSPAPSSAEELRVATDCQHRLQEIGLPRDQARTLAMAVSGFELSLREMAELVDGSYAKTRQDYSRGLRRVEDWIGLTQDQTRAYTTYRRFGSVERVAARLGLPAAEARSLLEQANQKIHQALLRLDDDPLESST